MHLFNKTVTCHKWFSWILLQFRSIACFWENRHMSQMVFLNFCLIREHCIFLIKPSHVTYGVLNFTKLQEHCISLIKPSHVTNGVLEFYFNSGALHLCKKTISCHKWCCWILHKFGNIASLYKPLKVSYGILEFYLNSGALHFYKEKNCHMSQIVFLNFYLNSGALHLYKKASHVTNCVLEFYFNSRALHVSEKTVTCHKWCFWSLLKFGSIASL